MSCLGYCKACGIGIIHNSKNKGFCEPCIRKKQNIDEFRIKMIDAIIDGTQEERLDLLRQIERFEQGGGKLTPLQECLKGILDRQVKG